MLAAGRKLLGLQEQGWQNRFPRGTRGPCKYGHVRQAKGGPGEALKQTRGPKDP